MRALVVILASLGVVCVCQARIITVDDDGPPADFDNIQAAIDDSNDGDTVIVADGTYKGPGNRDIDFLGKAITVRSTDPNDWSVVAATFIDCQGTIADLHRGFNFHSGEGRNSVVAGFTITNGYVGDGVGGGGILCQQSSPTIKNNIIRGNFAYSSDPEFSFCPGGGMYCRNSSAIITDNVITNNWVTGGGGGIFALDSSLTLTNNIITVNRALAVGGFFPGPGSGGGIQSSNSSLIIINNTISDNHARGSIIWGEFVPGEGGGIHCYYSYLTLVNSILWGNSPDEIRFDAQSTIKISYSDIQGGWSGTGNINANPRFASATDYHLQSAAGRWNPGSQIWVQDGVTSPCIDAGNPGCPLGNEPNDVNNIRINMGTYGGTAEASKSPAKWALLADLTNNRIVDFIDLDVFVQYWLETGHCIPGDLNRNKFVDFTDFAIFGDN